MSRVPESEVGLWLAKIPDWRREGNKLVRGFMFKNFREALAFVVQVAMLAERMDHHPDIVIRYKQVELCLTTHSADGLTDKDFELAQQIDAILR
ncbi:MAG: 4a-hydroxytetrahydrobiopterin dehydratase [Armatimonadota bacterium]